MIVRRPLTEGWTLTCADPDVAPVAATVPGLVHTDLMAAGRIPDPYLDDNETRLAWIGRADWTYATTFEWAADTAGGRADLACDGLDTVAEIEVNGVVLGRTANMHRRYRFDLAGALRPGPNTLTIRFASPYEYAERLRAELGDRPSAYPEPFGFIRKMACNFGWDWGPTLVSAGIWQPIGVETWRTARLAEVRPEVTVRDGQGHVALHVTLERAADAPVRLSASIAGADAHLRIDAGATGGVLEMTVPAPELWWPRGHGRQPRYDLALTLTDAGGEPLDTWRRRVGFRTVRLDTSPDAIGSAFTLVVNDRPIFVKGVNWIPDDVFVTRVTRERYAERLAQAAAANINYLRVWGGGRYESEDFYDLADEMGLMVGQDFLFACAAYPEEEPLRSEVAAEAAEQVVRLASHPSLVMWTGNNENIWGYHDWGWPAELDGRTWGAGYYFDLLPAITARLDPTRPYWPGSPYSGSRDIHPNDPDHGTTHIWDVWNERDYVHYRDRVPRFVAEFGYQAPPAYATLRRAVSDDPLTHDSPGLRHHQKAIDGDLKLRRGLEAHLPTPRNFDDWHYLTQVNQARAVALAVEWFRAHQPTCMGSVVWQLNDCWPVTSWAAIDGDGRPKPLWYALKHAYADRLLTIRPDDGGLAVVAVNDSARPWNAPIDVTRFTLDGDALAKHTVTVDVPPRGVVSVTLPAEIARPSAPAAEVLRATADGEHAWWFFAEDRDIAYPPARFRVTVEHGDDDVRLTVTAQTILRDLSVFPDRLDPGARVDTALVTLLPGESTTFVIRGAPGLEAGSLACRPVLRCVNDIG
jgi:beta-mannosidase